MVPPIPHPPTKTALQSGHPRSLRATRRGTMWTLGLSTTQRMTGRTPCVRTKEVPNLSSQRAWGTSQTLSSRLGRRPLLVSTSGSLRYYARQSQPSFTMSDATAPATTRDATPPFTPGPIPVHNTPSTAAPNTTSEELRASPADFACKICSRMPADPTVTVCGHLFCHRYEVYSEINVVVTHCPL